MRPLKVASLFTGAGGADLGLQQAGHTIILQAECDEAANKVLECQFPDVSKRYCDVNAVPRLPPDTDLVFAGFPCVDISRCGGQAGLNGDRSGLFFVIIDLLEKAIADHRPVPFVLLENVEALLDRVRGADGGLQEPAIARVVDKLTRLNYMVAYRVIDAAAFGLPASRRRVFILASLYADPCDILLAQGRDECVGACVAACGGPCSTCVKKAIHAANGGGNAGTPPLDSTDVSAHTSAVAFDAGHALAKPAIGFIPCIKTSNTSIVVVAPGAGYGRLEVEAVEALMGFEPGYTAAAGEKIHRWKLLGNAVSVPVAAWLGERLLELAEFKYIVDDRDVRLDVGGGVAAGRAADADTAVAAPTRRVCRSATRPPTAPADADDAPRWPRAAWCIEPGAVFKSCACAAPVVARLRPLTEMVGRLDPITSEDAINYIQKLDLRNIKYDSLIRVAAAAGLVLPRMDVPSAGVAGPWAPELMGDVVWARTENGKWWPAEAVNPHRPPRPIPDDVLAGPSPVAAAAPPAVTASPPVAAAAATRARRSARPPAPGTQSSLIQDTGAAGADSLPPPGADQRRDGLGATAAAATARPILASFFGGGCPAPPPRWTTEGDVMAWTPANHAIAKREASRSGAKRAHARAFPAAVAEADAVVQAKRAACGGGGAGTVAPLPPCGVCQACTRGESSSRRTTAPPPCLLVKAAAAARKGRAGAQLTVLGAAAVGARVELWNASRNASAAGVIAAFDAASLNHAISFDRGGGVEIAALWSARHFVRVTTDRVAWPADAAALASARKKAAVTALRDGSSSATAARSRQKRVRARAPGGSVRGAGGQKRVAPTEPGASNGANASRRHYYLQPIAPALGGPVSNHVVGRYRAVERVVVPYAPNFGSEKRWGRHPQPTLNHSCALLDAMAATSRPHAPKTWQTAIPVTLNGSFARADFFGAWRSGVREAYIKFAMKPGDAAPGTADQCIMFVLAAVQPATLTWMRDALKDDVEARAGPR